MESKTPRVCFSMFFPSKSMKSTDLSTHIDPRCGNRSSPRAGCASPSSPVFQRQRTGSSASECWKLLPQLGSWNKEWPEWTLVIVEGWFMMDDKGQNCLTDVKWEWFRSYAVAPWQFKRNLEKLTTVCRRQGFLCLLGARLAHRSGRKDVLWW